MSRLYVPKWLSLVSFYTFVLIFVSALFHDKDTLFIYLFAILLIAYFVVDLCSCREDLFRGHMISCGWVNYGFFIFILYEWVCGYFEYNLSISEWFSVWFGLMRRSSFVLVSSIATLIFGGLYVVRFLKNIDIFEHMILSHFNNDDFSKIRGFIPFFCSECAIDNPACPAPIIITEHLAESCFKNSSAIFYFINLILSCL